eukprot:GHVT01032978.1.p1 GENE.GHVT01032978.1~~GHVT01032978.1.p1  ORF type:complete len:156 (+),score=25.91 GHVT01032978.1:174-641(+)
MTARACTRRGRVHFPMCAWSLATVRVVHCLSPCVRARLGLTTFCRVFQYPPVCADVVGLEVIRPQGAMYCMVRFDPIAFPGSDSSSSLFPTSVEFAERLLAEESVFVLPGEIFNIQNFFRIVTAAPIGKLQEACRWEEQVAEEVELDEKNEEEKR